MMLMRVRQGEAGAPARIEAPAAPTVTLTPRSTGAPLEPIEAQEVVGDVYGIELDDGLVAELEVYDALWATGGWAARTVIEVCGGRLFDTWALAGMRLGQSTIGEQHDEHELESMRLIVETALEDACGGAAFTPRLAVETHTASGGPLLLDRSRARRVRTIDGQPSGARVDDAGIVPGAWPRGRVVRVAYEHGRHFPPPRVSRSGLLLAKRWLVEGPVDDRATSMSNDAGTFTLITPGMRGHLFDLPEVNAVVAAYSEPSAVA